MHLSCYIISDKNQHHTFLIALLIAPGRVLFQAAKLTPDKFKWIVIFFRSFTHTMNKDKSLSVQL